jgi:uncharacterized protein (TIGR04255 family)
VPPTPRKPPRKRKSVGPGRLTNPPITEAQIDFQLANFSPISVETIRLIAAQFARQYPLLSDQPLLQMQVNVGGGPLQSTSWGFGGVIRRSTDARDVLLCRMDGCAYSRLAPYGSWEEILPRALAIWNAYRQATGAGAARVTVRYLNVIHIPAEAPDLYSYLKYPPDAPLSKASTVRGFYSMVTMFETDSRIQASVLQSALPGPIADRVPIALNVEAFLDNVEPSAIAASLDLLRKTKNRLFFGSLTPLALRPYR